ncbi:MAG: hypothetical protein ACLUE8_01365 [Lachnospiraceae bacterium]
MQLQALVDPICDRYEVLPESEMALNLTAVSSGPERLPLDAKGLTGMNLIGALMTVIVSVLHLLCGGSGVALIAAGPLGFLAGALLGTAVSLFGMDALTGPW